jgi:hypothetical protein
MEDRRAWDMRSCDNIFTALNLNLTNERAVRFCRRVGERGTGPRPLVVGFRREEQKEDVLENAKNLRNTQFEEVVIIPDLTQEQRKDEADMVNEAEVRNRDLTEEDKAKNLEWMLVGARGEWRMIKGVKRTADRGGQTPKEATRTSLAPVLLPDHHQQGPWVLRTGAGGARGAAGKRRRPGDQEGMEADEMEEEDLDNR